MRGCFFRRRLLSSCTSLSYFMSNFMEKFLIKEIVKTKVASFLRCSGILLSINMGRRSQGRVGLEES